MYAVEASDMALRIQKLVESSSNAWIHKVKVVHQKIEDAKDIERVDVLISEPIGVLLVHERMLLREMN